MDKKKAQYVVYYSRKYSETKRYIPAASFNNPSSCRGVIDTTPNPAQTPPRHYQRIQQIPGIGLLLGMLIILESGDFKRFRTGGDYASYCRAVKSARTSNEKRRDAAGNRKGVWLTTIGLIGNRQHPAPPPETRLPRHQPQRVWNPERQMSDRTTT